MLARVLETDPDVQNYLQPHPQEFNITYNHGHSYEPDFVVSSHWEKENGYKEWREGGSELMAKKLDAERRERARHQNKSHNRREEEKQRIQESIAKKCSGERKGKVIIPKGKMYAFPEASKVRVAAYCRVSTAKETQDGNFEMQVQHFTSVIKNNPAYDLVKIYTDEGVSGTSVDRRKGLQQMVTDAKNGKIDLILAKIISRFGRNIVDILTSLRKLSDLTPPIAINFESEGINTSDDRNKLVISILSALAELESQQKIIAIKEGIRYRMEEDLY